MKQRNTTTTVTRVNVREALNRAPTGTLTREEEMVLRMRHGVPVDANAELGLVGQQFTETRARLAMIERLALDALSQDDEVQQEAPEAANPLKAHIIDRLNRS